MTSTSFSYTSTKTSACVSRCVCLRDGNSLVESERSPCSYLFMMLRDRRWHMAKYHGQQMPAFIESDEWALGIGKRDVCHEAFALPRRAPHLSCETRGIERDPVEERTASNLPELVRKCQEFSVPWNIVSTAWFSNVIRMFLSERERAEKEMILLRGSSHVSLHFIFSKNCRACIDEALPAIQIGFESVWYRWFQYWWQNRSMVACQERRMPWSLRSNHPGTCVHCTSKEQPSANREDLLNGSVFMCDEIEWGVSRDGLYSTESDQNHRIRWMMTMRLNIK